MLEIQIRDGHHVVDMDYVDKNKNKDNEARDIFKAFFEQERPDLEWSKIEAGMLDTSSIYVTDIRAED